MSHNPSRSRLPLYLEIAAISWAVLGLAVPLLESLSSLGLTQPLEWSKWGIPLAIFLWISAALLRALSRLSEQLNEIQSISPEILRSLNVLADEGRERKRVRDEEAKRQRIAEAEQRIAQ